MAGFMLSGSGIRVFVTMTMMGEGGGVVGMGCGVDYGDINYMLKAF